MIPIIIIYITVACFAIFGLRYHTHMLQLSSYQFQGYFRHLRTDRTRDIGHVVFLLFCLAFVLGGSISMILPAIAIVLCILIVLEATRMGVGMIMDGKQIDVNKLANMFTDVQ